MAVTVRLLQAHEAGLANRFFNDVYKTERPLKNFEWEFINGPSGKAIYVVAIDDSITVSTKIVGIQCAIPIEMIGSKGEIILTAKSEDTLVDPSYRGQKIFERMYDLLFEECRKAGISYIWGFTPAQKAFERIGFHIPFKTEQALLVFKPLEAYGYLKSLNVQNKTTDKFKIFGLALLSWTKRVSKTSADKTEITETPLSAMNDHFKSFYGDHGCATINETNNYLSWRLNQNPFGNQYRNFEIKKDGKLLLAALVNIRKNVGYIEQLFYKPGTDIQSGLASLIDFMGKQNIPLIRAFCFSSNEVLKEQGSELSKAGFTYLKRGNYFVWKSLDDHNRILPEQLVITRLFTQGNL